VDLNYEEKMLGNQTRKGSAGPGQLLKKAGEIETGGEKEEARRPA